jgi:hypothetical protein
MAPQWPLLASMLEKECADLGDDGDITEELSETLKHLMERVKYEFKKQL